MITPRWLWKIGWFFNVPGRIRLAERERCIRVLCGHDLGVITALTRDGKLDDQWIRHFLHPYVVEVRS